MSYNAVPSVANGDSWSAAQHNTYIKDNFAAVWVGTTAGDMDYYSAANAKARLAIGISGYILSVVSGIPTWVARPFLCQVLLNTDVALNAGDDAARIRIPSTINGWNLTGVGASRKSGTGVPTIQIRNVTTSFDMLSTRITIDSGETDSATAATPPVIDTAHDDVSSVDQIAVDVDVAGTNTLCCIVALKFDKP